MSQENIEIARRFVSLGERRPEDLTDDLLKQFFDPDVEWIPLPQGVLAGNTYVGFDGIRRFSIDFFAAWDELVVEPQEFRDEGDLVVAVMRMRGRMHELEIDEMWSGLFTFHNGRIIRVEAFSNPHEALEAAGFAR